MFTTSPWSFSSSNNALGVLRSNQQGEGFSARRTSPFLSNGRENNYDDNLRTINSALSYTSVHSHGEDRCPLGDITLNINRAE